MTLCACSGEIASHGDGADPGNDNSGTPGALDASFECDSITFPVTETQESFVVPDRVRYMHIKAWGAGGNGEGYCAPGQADSEGGLGGYTEGIFEAEPGQELLIMVGKRGRAGTSGEDPMRFGFGGWGGGGLTGVFAGGDLVHPDDNSRALLIAGGGGSAGLGSCDPGGTGNAPSSGGATTMQGALGDEEINGGGGGYVGGRGGQGGGAGAGGMGFVSNEALESRLLSAQPGAGAPPNTADSDYADHAGATEQSGRLVIHFSCDRPQID